MHETAEIHTIFQDACALKAEYTRINEHIVRVVCVVPHGCITTVEAISHFLRVPAHHVTYLLARRSDANDTLPGRPDEVTPSRLSWPPSVPWHRVLAHRGAIGRPFLDANGRTQAQNLMAEGVAVDVRGRIADFDTRFFALTPASTGVTPKVR